MFSRRTNWLTSLSAGPMLATGNELATAASQALGIEIKYENISE